MLKYFNKGFLLGYITHILVTVFVQDWYGKEEYLRIVDSNWLNLHWLVSVVALFLLLNYVYQLKKLFMKRNNIRLNLIYIILDIMAESSLNKRLIPKDLIPALIKLQKEKENI